MRFKATLFYILRMAFSHLLAAVPVAAQSGGGPLLLPPFAQVDCDLSLTGEAAEPFTEDSVTLGHEAVRLFQDAERELFSAVGGGNFRPRAINPEFALRLQDMARRLEAAPGDQTDYVEIFQELAQVMEGSKPCWSYSRREIFGYEAGRSPDLLRAWDRIDQITGHSGYREIERGIYATYRSSGKALIPGITDHEKRVTLGNETIMGLLANPMGKMTLRDSSKSNGELDFVRFDLMSVRPDELGEDVVYRLLGYQVILKGSGEVRTVIQSVTRPSPKGEKLFYEHITRQLSWPEKRLRFPQPIEGRGELQILARIRFKIERKHKIPVSDIEDLFLGVKPPRLEVIGFKKNHYAAAAMLKGRPVTIILMKDRFDPNRLVLKTAYFTSVHQEQIYRDQNSMAEDP